MNPTDLVLAKWIDTTWVENLSGVRALMASEKATEAVFNRKTTSVNGVWPENGVGKFSYYSSKLPAHF